VERHFEDVGDRFAEVAVKMHQGLERNIRGMATQSEEEYLAAEGIPVMKVPSFKFNSLKYKEYSFQ
jgi:hypothetical protein